MMASAIDCACRMRSSKLLRKLLAKYKVSESEDFLSLCLSTAFESLGPLKSWPPFQVPLPLPSFWDARSLALEPPKLWEELLTEEGLLCSELQGCCELLLSAGAKVTEQTLTLLTLLLPQGLAPPLLEAMVARCSPADLAWPLLAAVETGEEANEAAVRLLLHSRADPCAHGGAALATAAARGDVGLLRALLAAALAAPGSPGSLQCSAAFLSPRPWPAKFEEHPTVNLVLVAARFGQAECIALLSEARDRSDEKPELWFQEVADQAAAAGHSDIAHWLQANAANGSPKESASASAKVLSFEVQQGTSRFEVLDPVADVQLFEAIVVSAKQRGQPSVSRTGAFCAVDMSAISFVSTVAEASAAVERLRSDISLGVAAVGVDLECYHEVVCTVQVSWQRCGAACHCIFDALLLHDDMNKILGKLLSDPSIVKIFHSPHNDLRWLRSNFGLSVCNLFDTAAAYRQIRKEVTNSVSLKEVCAQMLSCSLEDEQEQALHALLRLGSCK